MMTHNEIRRTLIDYFVERGHEHVPSASLVPADDATLLFTTAGMVQFKSFYATTGDLPYQRAVTIQKCLRAGGKDSDLEAVGRSPRHLTFFEMLGHFSFGDYFKDEAVEMAWDFFTRVLDVDLERLWVSVFKEDDETEEIWKKVGFPADRIVRLGAEDNFWGPAGDTGACGPNTEIYWDLGPEFASGQVGGGPGLDDRYVEVWNTVFPQFDHQLDGSRPTLPNRGIDMGAGLERMAAMIQGKTTIFDTDLFRPLLDGILDLTDYSGPEEGEALVALRRTADHARALAFTLAEGLRPSNVGRGYVLRRILRRGMMALRTLGVQEPMLYRVIGLVVDHMGEARPELREGAEMTASVVRGEEERFLRTLEQGVSRYRELVEDCRRRGSDRLAGDEVFRLYSTYGIPWEMTREMAEEEDLTVDEEGYRLALEEDRRLSQEAGGFSGEDGGKAEAAFSALVDDPPPSEFAGYDALAIEARVTEYRLAGEEMLELVLDRTPFYAAAGGQESDRGSIAAQSLSLTVSDVRAAQGRIVHQLALPSGTDAQAVLAAFKNGVTASVDPGRRRAVARAHTGTHLLHAALRRVLGEGASQAGSLVEADRLRFDFHHHQALTADQIEAVEETVGAWILADLQVETKLSSYAEATESGAMALFGEKYGDEVRVVRMGEVSTELCGGTHLSGSAGVGLLAVTSESSVASGVRRIEAVTGLEAQSLSRDRAAAMSELSRVFKAPENEIARRVEEALADRLTLRRELESLRASQAAERSSDLLAAVGSFGGLDLQKGEIEAGGAKELRSMADSLRGRLDGSIGALLGRAGGKLSLVVIVPDDLTGRGWHAGRLVSLAAAAIGARGGGSPTMAMAGLPDEASFAPALDALGAAMAAGEGRES